MTLLFSRLSAVAIMRRRSSSADFSSGVTSVLRLLSVVLASLSVTLSVPSASVTWAPIWSSGSWSSLATMLLSLASSSGMVLRTAGSTGFSAFQSTLALGASGK